MSFTRRAFLQSTSAVLAAPLLKMVDVNHYYKSGQKGIDDVLGGGFKAGCLYSVRRLMVAGNYLSVLDDGFMPHFVNGVKQANPCHMLHGDDWWMMKTQYSGIVGWTGCTGPTGRIGPIGYDGYQSDPSTGWDGPTGCIGSVGSVGPIGCSGTPGVFKCLSLAKPGFKFDHHYQGDMFFAYSAANDEHLSPKYRSKTSVTPGLRATKWLKGIAEKYELAILVEDLGDNELFEAHLTVCNKVVAVERRGNYDRVYCDNAKVTPANEWSCDKKWRQSI